MQVKIAFNLGRVWQHYQGKRFAIVSAYLGESSPEINKARAAALKRAVRERGYGYVEMEGHWIETRGKHKGKELKEYPLFIPGATVEDAIYFGSGEYFPKEPFPQQAIIVGNGENILLLGSTSGGAWSTVMEFKSLQTNLEAALKRWAEQRAKLEKDELPTEEAEDEYMGWSSIRGKPWKFSQVTLAMIEPPSADASGSWGGSMLRGHWNDSDPHDYYVAPADVIKYRGATYNRVIGSAEIREHLKQNDNVRFEFLPKRRLRVLAKGTDKPIVVGSWKLVKSKKDGMVLGYPLRRKKRWSFTTAFHIPEKQQTSWNVNQKNVLKSTDAYNDSIKVGKMSWHPGSGELLLAPESEQHAITIHNNGSHPFDEYVRLIVLHEKNKVLARPWSPTGSLEDEEDRAASFEAQFAAKEMLEKAGMPASWKFEMDTSNPRLERLTGRRRW